MAMEDELSPEMLAARARLRERCSQTQQIGGKGTVRRKTRKSHKSVLGDDKKLQLTLKRLGAASIFGVEEVFLLRERGSGLHFLNPKVQAAPTANTYVISGHCEDRSNAASLLGVRGFLGGGGSGSGGRGLAGMVAGAAALGGGGGGGGGGLAGTAADGLDEGSAAAAMSPEMLRQFQQHMEAISNDRLQKYSAKVAADGGLGAAGDKDAARQLSPQLDENTDEDVPDLVESFEEASEL